jgi:prophage regulatory protein
VSTNANEVFTVSNCILRLRAVREITGLSRSGIYAKIAAGEFPQPVNLGARAVGWPEHEVQAINAARIAGKSTDDIRSLIAAMKAERVKRFAALVEAP